MRFFILLPALLLVAPGCSMIDFQGSAPPSHIADTDPRYDDYTSGANLTFAVQSPSDYHTTTSADGSLILTPTVDQSASISDTK